MGREVAKKRWPLGSESIQERILSTVAGSSTPKEDSKLPPMAPASSRVWKPRFSIMDSIPRYMNLPEWNSAVLYPAEVSTCAREGQETFPYSSGAVLKAGLREHSTEKSPLILSG